MKRILLAMLLAMSVLALAACGGAKPSASPAGQTAPVSRTFKTDLGDLTLDKVPTRVVAINLQAIDSLVALGVKPAGYAEPGGEPITYLGDALKGIPTVGTHSKPSLESIAALQPDLIVIDSLQQKDQAAELRKIAPVLAIRAMSYQDAMSQLQLLGDMLGEKAEADKFVADFDTKVKAFTAKAAGKQGPKVVAMYGTAERAWTWMPQSFVGSLLTAVNAGHVYQGAGDKEYPDQVNLSVEKLAELNPQVFFFMSTPGKELSKTWATNPALKGTDAVKQGRVHEVDRQAWSRSRGPIAAGKVLEEAFPLLYPNAK